MSDQTFEIAILAVTFVGAIVVIRGIWFTVKYLKADQKKRDDHARRNS